MQKLLDLYKFVRHTPKGVLVLGMFLLGLVLRGPVSAYAPIALTIEEDFGIDQATVGLLSGLPVFCFAVFAPLGSYLIVKKGLINTLFYAFGIMAFGIGLRLVENFYSMLVATIIMGAAIGVGNVVFPLVASREFPKRFPLVSGLTSAAMNVGAVCATALTFPLSTILGWQMALGLWGIVLAAVAAVWVAYFYRAKRGASRKSLKKAINRVVKEAPQDSLGMPKKTSANQKSNDIAARNIYKHPLCYALCFIFICQCFSYFGLSAWLPAIFTDLGLDPSAAGGASSLFQLLGIFGSISVAGMLRKLDFTKTFLIIAVSWILLPATLLFAPQLWFVGVSLAGFAQGGNYIIMFSKIANWSRVDQETRSLSSIVQISAYLVAGITPSIIGAIHSMSGTWKIPLGITLASLIAMLICGTLTYLGKFDNSHARVL